MDKSFAEFTENLITTKDARELSGYSADYIARVARSRKVIGKKVGHSWFIDKKSLVRFIDLQKSHKVEYAHTLAKAREAEYRAHQPSSSVASYITRSPSRPHAISLTDGSHLYSHAFALSAACMVLVFSACLAQTTTIPRFAEGIGAAAHTIASGFIATFGDVPSHIVLKMDQTTKDLNTRVARADIYRTSLFTHLTRPLFAETVIAPLLATRISYDSVFRVESFSPQETALLSSGIALHQMQSFFMPILATISSPEQFGRALAENYYAVGEYGYNVARASLALDVTLVRSAGILSLAAATALRDAVAVAPTRFVAVSFVASHFITEMNLALGSAIIDGTHFSIHTDIALAYTLSEAIPASGQVAVTALITIGNTLASAATHTPALSSALFMRVAGMPAIYAPIFTQAVFNLEYKGGLRFVAITDNVLHYYYDSIQNTGRLVYTGAEVASALAAFVSPR